MSNLTAQQIHEQKRRKQVGTYFGEDKVWSDMEDYENFPPEVKKLAEKCGDDTVWFTQEMNKIGYEVETDFDGTVIQFSKL